MDRTLRQLLSDGDERAFDEAFAENKCSHFFAVDFHEDDADIVADCARCLGLDQLRAESRNDSLVIVHGNKETVVPLAEDDGDRHITVCTLNDVLQPDFEIRFLVCSHGSDTVGFAVLSTDDWRALELEFPQAIPQNFVPLRALPNVFTEMTDNHLPTAARARFQRMLDRNRRSPRK